MTKKEGKLAYFKIGNRRGQVTIFIIIGIIIVVAVASFFLFRSNLILQIGGQQEKNPTVFLSSCIEPFVRDGIEKISMQGGYLESPLHVAFKFDDDKTPHNISYLCYSGNDYFLCSAQEPKLSEHIKEELHTYLDEDVETCFGKLISNMEKRGYAVENSYSGFEIELNDDKVDVSLLANLVATKSDETVQHEKFKLIFKTKFYNLIKVAQEIVNSEAIKGEFNHYDLLVYPDFDISKVRTSDSSNIYRIKHRETGEEFRFAVRGAIIPSGFGFKV